jgi:YHS domain-containing protein
VTRFLLLAVLVIVALHVVGRFIMAILAGATPARRATKGPAGTGELMRRDPVCGTFVLPSRAIAAKGTTGVHYFCSEKCRDVWAAGKAAPEAAGRK